MAVKTNAQLKAQFLISDPKDHNDDLVDSMASGTQQSNIADAVALTENSSTIGGTNDGDLPDLSSPDATINAAAIRELATAVNTLTVKVNSIIAALEAFEITASS